MEFIDDLEDVLERTAPNAFVALALGVIGYLAGPFVPTFIGFIVLPFLLLAIVVSAFVALNATSRGYDTSSGVALLGFELAFLPLLGPAFVEFLRTYDPGVAGLSLLAYAGAAAYRAYRNASKIALPCALPTAAAAALGPFVMTGALGFLWLGAHQRSGAGWLALPMAVLAGMWLIVPGWANAVAAGRRPVGNVRTLARFEVIVGVLGLAPLILSTSEERADLPWYAGVFVWYPAVLGVLPLVAFWHARAMMRATRDEPEQP